MKRNRQHIIHQTPKKRTRLSKVVLFLLGLIFIVLGAIFIAPISLHIHLITPDSQGNLTIYSFDGQNAVALRIPSETKLIASGDLGNWPARSVWKLGVDEKMGGTLMQRSVIKTFGVPVTNWGSSTLDHAVSQGVLGALPVFVTTETNLSLLERINLAIVIIRGVKLTNRDILGTSALETTTEDGETKYIVREQIPISLLTQFDEDFISNLKPAIGIEDGTESSEVSRWLTKLMSVLGGRVVSHDKISFDGVCEISGIKSVVSYIKKLLPCSVTNESASPFDVKIKLGKSFNQTM